MDSMAYYRCSAVLVSHSLPLPLPPSLHPLPSLSLLSSDLEGPYPKIDREGSQTDGQGGMRAGRSHAGVGVRVRMGIPPSFTRSPSLSPLPGLLLAQSIGDLGRGDATLALGAAPRCPSQISIIV